MRIIIADLFFIYRLTVINDQGKPLDFMHVYKNKDIAQYMQVSPYLHHVFLVRVIDYLKAMDVFIVRMPDGQDGFIRNKGSQPLVVTKQKVSKVAKLQIGQRIIVQCIMHDVEKGKKPFMSSEIRLKHYDLDVILGQRQKKKKKPIKKDSSIILEQKDEACEELYNDITHILSELTNGFEDIPFYIHKKNGEHDIGYKTKEYFIMCVRTFVDNLKEACLTKKSVILSIHLRDKKGDALANTVFDLMCQLPDNRSSLVIEVNNSEIAKILAGFLFQIDPKLVDMIVIMSHQDLQRYLYIDDIYNSLFDTSVLLDNGAVIHIGNTHAGHMIDIDMGHVIDKNMPQRYSLYQANYEAIQCIFNHIRWRNLHGLICIDIVNMLAKDIRALYRDVLMIAKCDNVRVDVLPPSRFQVIELTRQCVYPCLISNFTQRRYLLILDRVLQIYQKRRQEQKVYVKRKLLLSKALYDLYRHFQSFIDHTLELSYLGEFDIQQGQFLSCNSFHLEELYTIV